MLSPLIPGAFIIIAPIICVDRAIDYFKVNKVNEKSKAIEYTIEKTIETRIK